MRSALLWEITQRTVVILFRSFGTTYRSHPRGSRILLTDSMCRNSGKVLPLYAV